MADHKDDAAQAAKLAQSKKPTMATSSSDTGGDNVAGVRAGSERAPPQNGVSEKSDRPSVSVVRRKQRYLIGLRSMPIIASGQGEAFLDRLNLMEGVQVVRKLRTRGDPAYASAEYTSTHIVVVQMDEQRGEALRQTAPPHVIVEIDAPVNNSDLAALEPFGWQLRARAMSFLRSAREIRFTVIGADDRPLANASINLFGPGFPAQASTNTAGQATVQTFATEATDIQALYVRPAADYWQQYIQNPSLDLERINVIRLRPLMRKPANSEVERPHGWGQRMMQFDRLSADWNGVGIRVGIIDSGCDASHPSLRHVIHGTDLTRSRDSESWRSDELGNGTHCAGIIAGAVAPGAEIVGCAPGSEVHVMKVAPRGYCSDLIEALDTCIEQRLDIVQIGVHCEQFSELVAQKIAAVQRHGIACIMGAGNSGGPVQFPAGIPGVLTVAAVGKVGEYPPDTRHAQRALPQIVAPNGLFTTYFSCWGPQAAVCAPGVAIVSSVPGGGYAAWDGTSMAASHVTGLAAVLLSRHPALQVSQYTGRLEERAAHLFELIRFAALPLPQTDPNRVGAGLPELERVPSMLPAAAYGYAAGYGTGAGAGAADLARAAMPAYVGDPAAAIRQLRAAGLWV
jgi:subtilisin